MTNLQNSLVEIRMTQSVAAFNRRVNGLMAEGMPLDFAQITARMEHDVSIYSDPLAEEDRAAFNERWTDFLASVPTPKEAIEALLSATNPRFAGAYWKCLDWIEETLEGDVQARGVANSCLVANFKVAFETAPDGSKAEIAKKIISVILRPRYGLPQKVEVLDWLEEQVAIIKGNRKDARRWMLGDGEAPADLDWMRKEAKKLATAKEAPKPETTEAKPDANESEATVTAAEATPAEESVKARKPRRRNKKAKKIDQPAADASAPAAEETVQKPAEPEEPSALTASLGAMLLAKGMEVPVTAVIN